MELRGRTALVTGAMGGLGQAIVHDEPAVDVAEVTTGVGGTFGPLARHSAARHRDKR